MALYRIGRHHGFEYEDTMPAGPLARVVQHVAHDGGDPGDTDDALLAETRAIDAHVASDAERARPTRKV